MRLATPSLSRMRNASHVLSLALAIGCGIAVLAVYAALVERYFFLGDDSFISFRYAARLAEGDGLTWNAGERVEGYTNFLWVVAMATGISAGVAPEVLSVVLGIGSGLLVLGTLVWLSWQAGARGAWLWLAPAGLALSRTFAAWSTGGLETMAFAASVLLALVVFARRGATPASGVLLACATLLRPDGAVFAVVCGLFALHDAWRGRDMKRLAAWLLPYVLVVGGHLLWRRAYYGFWLPNTFYAKVSGVWWEQAQHYFGAFFSDYRLHLFLPLLLTVAFFGKRLHAVFAAAIALYSLFLAAVGGDVFEFRLLVPLLPLAYWLLAESLRWIAGFGWKGALPAALGAAALLTLTWLGTESPDARKKRHGIESIEDTRWYAGYRIRQGKGLRALIDRGLLPRDLVLATGGAGALPYYTGWTTVDVLGLNDTYVAHLPIEKRGKVAHEKYAPFAYLQERKVALVDVTGRGLLHDRIDPKWHRPIRRRYYRGPLKIFRVDGRYLVFGTTLSDEELHALLPGLEQVR